jgi:tRNA-dihydrouridine synthase B
MQIGPYKLSNNLVLAPMAGISDRPFRNLCKQFGAGLAVSEMVAANPALRQHHKTQLKANHHGETGIRSVQILGTDPQQMAEAARYNAQQGANIIDINMGCPAKKVCSVAAGSALLKNEALVKNILDAVVNAVDIPVTLKIRTGWDKDQRNAVRIAQIAQQAGIAALTIHGRTRACKFEGQAEYETIKQVKENVSIPIIANGDIDSPEKAKSVLELTGADALMIGRAAQGNPWLFKEINDFFLHGQAPTKPNVNEIHQTLIQHLDALHSFYGNEIGVRMARKHIGWYCKHLSAIPRDTLNTINQAQQPSEQIALINSAFNLLS